MSLPLHIPFAFPFDEKKAAAAGAVLLDEAGGRMEHLRLIKLLYLAERESIRRWHAPIVGGAYCSMKYGPVTATVYDLVKEKLPAPYWDRQILREPPYGVRLKGTLRLEALSLAEIELLRSVSREHKKTKTFELCKQTHKLPEYTETTKSSIPIDAEEILKAVGKSPAQIKEAEQDAARQAKLAAIFR